MERLKLRARIVEKYGTNKAFAKHLGIAPYTVTNVIKGRTTPTTRQIPKWCDALEIAPEETGIFFTIKPQKTDE